MMGHVEPSATFCEATKLDSQTRSKAGGCRPDPPATPRAVSANECAKPCTEPYLPHECRSKPPFGVTPVRQSYWDAVPTKSWLCTQPSPGPTREATTVTAPAPFKEGEGKRWVHATNARACNLAAEPLH